jgi:hypothetical protein
LERLANHPEKQLFWRGRRGCSLIGSRRDEGWTREDDKKSQSAPLLRRNGGEWQSERAIRIGAELRLAWSQIRKFL